VVSGGGTGIVVPCLRALAARRLRVLLLGRTNPQGDGPRAVEIRDNLARLREEGLEVTWGCCDLTDRDAVAAAVGTFRARHGRIDGVVHAAGVLADGVAEASSDADRQRVLGAKVAGAVSLRDATAADDLALWCVFSSVTALQGNPGQTLYGAANAALERIEHPRAARHLALRWTAWSGVGMAAEPRLLELLERRGVHALSPAEGAAAFRTAVEGDCAGVVTVTAGAPPELAPPRWPLGPVTGLSGTRWTFALPLDPEHPALADHRIAGRPLVPAALWVCAMLEALRALAPNAGARSLVGFTVTAPTFVDRARDDVRISLEPTARGWDATVRTADSTVARAELVPCDDPARRAPPLPLDGSEPAEPLYRPDVLFHGPSWRVLERVRTNGNGRAEADLRPDAQRPLAGALDGAHQLLSAWSGRATGHLGLPVGAGRWVLSGEEATGPLRLETIARADGRDILADVVAVDPTGRVVLRGEAVRLQAAARYPEGADA
jgi:NAD(P)-dependent dehydrogenase (short-subunit alcohol dehydrogenase family)